MAVQQVSVMLIWTGIFTFYNSLDVLEGTFFFNSIFFLFCKKEKESDRKKSYVLSGFFFNVVF